VLGGSAEGQMYCKLEHKAYCKPSREPGFVWRHVVATAASLLTIFAAVSITGIFRLSRTELSHQDDPPAHIMPGQPLPSEARCAWYPYSGGDAVVCRMYVGYDTAFLTYDGSRRRILRTSLPLHNETVGQLILNWGQPTGVKRLPWATQVYWGTRSVYVSSLAFAPDNHTSFVSYTLFPEETVPWTGFSN
jgi:hypothetical protein